MGGKRLLLLRSSVPSSHFDRVLLSRIDSSNVPVADADAVVQHLRSRYPRDYSRIKLLPFARRVRTLLNQHHHPNDYEQDDQADDDDGQTPFENNDELTTTTTTSKKKRPHDDNDDDDDKEEEEEEEDAVFEAPVEPQFDVTRSMLLAHYQKKQQQQLLLLNNKNKNNKNKSKQTSTTSLVEEVETAVERPPPPRKRVLALRGDGSRTEEGSAPTGDVEVKGEDAGVGPRFRDFGGIDGVIEELVDEVIVPLCHPQLPRWLGVRPMAGILLHGPPGCGKTRLAHAIANETRVPFYNISATEVVSGISGESEGNIRELFRKAYRTAPSIVFIDEIDAIASKRENMQKEMERRIVTQLMTCMDESHQKLGSIDSDSDSDASNKKPGYVLVIGATNRPDAVDLALRRPGRFDREIVLGVPSENARQEILKVLTGKLRVEGTLDLSKIARSASGFVGADLKALVNKAGNLAMKRIIDRRKKFMNEGKEDKGDEWWKQPWTPEELQELSITMSDFEEAAKLVQPSLRREGFSSIPNVKWDDVGGLNSLRKEFERYIVQHIKNPDIYEELGVKLETGFLLYGPPGCGKTLIAKAVAHEAGANFIHIKGPELLNKYVGESELAVRTIFSRARTCSPCILFFDEVDALTTKRGKEGGWVVERLLNQLLIELDGADERHGVHVIGATNRLEVVDPAILRPGRLGKVMYVPLPDADERMLILKALVREKPLGADVDLDAIGRSESCRNLSGADLAEMVKEAAMLAVEERLEAMKVGGVVAINSVIQSLHFEQALKKVSPSVSEEERMYYEALSKRVRGT